MMCPLNLKNISKCPKVSNSVLVILKIVDEFQLKVNIGNNCFRCPSPLLALQRQHRGKKSHETASVMETPCVGGSELASDLPVASGRDIRLVMPAEAQGPSVSGRERREVLLYTSHSVSEALCGGIASVIPSWCQDG